MSQTTKKKLLIVESPAKAKTIGHYLDSGYQVLASVGHIMDLPKSNKNAIDIEHDFLPHYEITPGKEAVVKNLQLAVKKASEVILATDPDREGEAIAWHIANATGLNEKKTKRIVFHEITKEAVNEALKHPRQIDNNLRSAQEARRVLDRLFGYDLSGLIWQKLRYGLSAGRVQSPALRIIVEREKLIRSFIPVKYWVITADLETKKKETIIFTCAEEPKTEDKAKQIIEDGEKGSWTVEEVEETQASRRPRAPFTTSTLQQAASSRLGLSPALTMRHAQRLYEAGLITYMRTDSTSVSVAAANQIVALIKQKFGADYATGARVYKTKSKNAQEAHEAIRPTDASRLTAGAAPAEKKLYDLIWRRAVSSQMSDARISQTKIVARPDAGTLLFVAKGHRVLFDGWLLTDPAARRDDVELPAVIKGDPLSLISIDGEEKETTPPDRYSEAGLIKELEKRGIGRPSTYASTIKTLLDRDYVSKENRSLKPTDTGEVVSDFLETNFHNYVSDTFTAKMEDDLDEIADGKLDYITLLKHFYTPFKKAVAGKKKLEKISNLGPAPDGTICPKCGKAMIWKLGRAGKFMSCANFPDCDGARMENGEVMPEPEATGETCPDCGGKLVRKTGRYGEFIACSNYPKCKYIKNDDAAKDTGVQCPSCKKGTMVEKRGRYGLFYGCSNYPDCKNIIKAKPTGETCPECGALMMEGTKTIPVRCSNKACPNHKPEPINKAKKISRSKS